MVLDWVTAKGTGPHRGRVNATLLHPQAALWDMPVGNPVALCNTQHTGMEILTRPTSEYFANAVTMPPKKFVGTIRRFAKPPTDVTYFVLK